MPILHPVQEERGGEEENELSLRREGEEEKE